MLNTSTISVVIPAYNAESTIAETLDSVLVQTVPAHEIVVVDDVSPDDTVDVIKEWGVERGQWTVESEPFPTQVKAVYSLQSTVHAYPTIRIVESAKNGGPASARNIGVSIATGEWIAFLDADDAWLPEKTAIQLKAVESDPDVALICGKTVALEREFEQKLTKLTKKVGKVVGDGDTASNNPELSTAHSLQSTVYGLQSPLALVDFVYHNPVATSTVMVRREAVRDVGGFDTQFCGPEDYDLWMRLVAKHKCVELDAILTRYRTTVGSLSMDERQFLPEVLRVLAKAFGPGGALEKHQEWRRRAYAEQYSSASWMAYNRGAHGPALRYLLMSWLYDVRRLHKEQQDPLLRAKLLFRYMFRREPDVSA